MDALNFEAVSVCPPGIANASAELAAHRRIVVSWQFHLNCTKCILMAFMANFVPRRILGGWRDGYALDLHTLSSTYIGDNEYGHPEFATQRSEIGELLYRLKNKADQSVVPEIVDAAERHLRTWRPAIDLIVPVPPSTRRTVQPVLTLAKELSKKTGIPVAECVERKRDVPQLKNVYDLDERAKLLENLHSVDSSLTKGKRLLIFDDLYRSGATMNSITKELYAQGQAADVVALTITRTRSNR